MVIDLVRAAVAAEIVCSNNAAVDMSTSPRKRTTCVLCTLVMLACNS
jgi:hypothetical protein